MMHRILAIALLVVVVAAPLIPAVMWITSGRYPIYLLHAERGHRLWLFQSGDSGLSLFAVPKWPAKAVYEGMWLKAPKERVWKGSLAGADQDETSMYFWFIRYDYGTGRTKVQMDERDYIAYKRSPHDPYPMPNDYKASNNPGSPGIYTSEGLPFWRISFPHWLAVVVLGIPAIAWLARRAGNARRTCRRAKLGLCPRCGYDLRASKDRCPECGTPIKASNAADAR